VQLLALFGEGPRQRDQSVLALLGLLQVVKELVSHFLRGVQLVDGKEDRKFDL